MTAQKDTYSIVALSLGECKKNLSLTTIKIYGG